MEKIKLGVIGYGQRGHGVVKGLIIPHFENVVVTAVCDSYEDRTAKAKADCDKAYNHNTFATTDYHEMIDKSLVDCVIIFSAWESHIPVAIDFLNAGIPVGCEVGGAYSIQQCWDLVRTVERTKTKFMFLENCCYGRREMLCMNMADMGLFGNIAFCSGAYIHDLRGEIVKGFVNRHYRLRNFIGRNCDNYPTHDLGPIAKLLGINYNNRILTVSSTSSGAWGLAEYAGKLGEGYEDLAKTRFNEGDVVISNLKCAGGQMITLTHSTSLPQPYSRNFTVRGTKGCYFEDTRSVFLDSDHTQKDGDHWRGNWGNEDKYFEKYDHPTWKKFNEGGIVGGHGGMDGLVYGAYFDYCQDKISCPIDVYDAATWMSISTLSEQSLSMNGAPVAVPDFTDGKWLMNANKKTPLFGL